MVQREYGKRYGSVYWGAIVLSTFELLLKAHLNGNDIRVFLYLCSCMNYQNNICYENQKSISDNLQIHKSSVSKAIKILSEKQFIVKHLSPRGFMINPHLFYIAKRQRNERDVLREDFDNILSGRGLKPRFTLNEELNRLEIEDGD